MNSATTVRRTVTAEGIAEHLHARRSGLGWIARCPAHEDRSPSLSIAEGADGRILLHCFGQCTTQAVCASLGLTLADLFPQPHTVQAKPREAREAERHIQSLRSRLTPRERVLPVTVVYFDEENLEAGIARALALAVEGEIVQAVLEGGQ
jgi:CHC2 zinc finger